MRVKLLSRVRLLATPWTVAHQAPPSMGFSRQEYWSGVPTLSPFKCLKALGPGTWGKAAVYYAEVGLWEVHPTSNSHPSLLAYLPLVLSAILLNAS